MLHSVTFVTWTDVHMTLSEVPTPVVASYIVVREMNAMLSVFLSKTREHYGSDGEAVSDSI